MGAGIDLEMMRMDLRFFSGNGCIVVLLLSFIIMLRGLLMENMTAMIETVSDSDTEKALPKIVTIC